MSATKNINAEKIQGNLSISGVTATTISATTYQNLPTDNFVTGATYSDNTFTFTNKTGGTFSVSFNTVTGLTVNGGLTATTINGNGSNITGINFSQLATTAHTHSISDVINLQSNLDSKIDKPGSPFLGDYLYYNGVTWVPNQINIPVAAGAGVTLFLSVSGSSLPTYEYLSLFPFETVEVQESVIVNNNQVLIGKYATDQLNRTVVDPGIWEFNTYASTDIPSTGLTQIVVSAFLRTTGGTETFLFSSSTENITTTGATLYTMSVVEQQYSCNTTDYLIVNYSASTTNNFNTTVTLYHGGSVNYSHIHTPFITLHNDLAGIQGGLSNEHYHLSKNEVDLLTTGLDASSIHNHDSSYLGLGGGTVSGNTNFTNGLTATTFSASTYLGLPIDVFVTGGTYNNGTTTFTNNTGGTFNVTGFYTGMTDVFVTGASYNNANQFTFTNNTGGTFSVSFDVVTGLTANTISATTYQNLPIDVFTTGATKSGTVATFTNNTGGTFTLTGLTDTFVTGGTYSADTITFTNNTGGTFTVSGITTSSEFTGGTVSGDTIFENGLTASTISATTYLNLPIDIFVTGGTYSVDTITFTNNTGGTFTVTGITSSGGDFLPLSGGTVTGNTVFTSGLTTNTFNLSTTPTNNNSNTQVLSRNSVTGEIEYIDVNSILVFDYGLAYAFSNGNYQT